MPKNKRDLIFISHATPEDNTFTLWLSTRLKLIGYQVWSDVTKLFGGEKWWDDIEQSVDQFTCKFILVITRTSLSKPGVIRELELAFEAEKKHQIENFIIPIIIDDSPFGGQPYDLSDRNIIAFSTGWGPALAKLTERLDRDDVPKEKLTLNLGDKLSELARSALRVEQEPELLLSNWLNLESGPNALNFFRLPGDVKAWRKQLESFTYPWFEWGGMLASFVDAQTLQAALPRHISAMAAPKLDLDAVLTNGPRNHPKFLRGEVVKKLNFVMLDAWNKHMRALGLHRYELASGKSAWFFPNKEGFSGFQQFPDVYGVLRKKKLINFSGKNNVYWHYAVEAKPSWGVHSRVSLIPHVVFTQDGLNPLDDKAKMHRLRRGFCKNWWNDRWRDLLLLYMHLLTNEQNQLGIPVSESQTLLFEARPMMINSDFSLVGATPEKPSSGRSEAEMDVTVDDDSDFELSFEDETL